MPTTQNNPSFRYLILGLGQSGAAAARWCARQGHALRLADTRCHPPQLEALRAELADAKPQWVLGPEALNPAVLDQVDALVVSPGLAPTDPALAKLLAEAEVQGVECLNELTLFARALQHAERSRGYRPQVAAITGTNGKTTVACMVAHLLAAQSVQAQLAGNISPALLDAWLQCEQQQRWPEVWVVECSSFQLHGQQDFQPQVGALLNISQDHLDWHGSMTAYQAAKQRLLMQSSRVVINAQDPVVLELAQQVATEQRWLFATETPHTAQMMGLCDEQTLPVLCWADAQGQRHQLAPANILSMPGAHQVQNALAALAIIAALDRPVADCVGALADFQGAPHRCAFVRRLRDINFINDSKGTNVGATVAALTGLPGAKVVIAGGLGKGQNFYPLAAAAAQGQVQHWVLFGADAPAIAQVLAQQGLAYTQVAHLQAAVQTAFKLAAPDQTVLFSPACASMDQFKNYEARGQAFVEAVEELALELGEVL